MDFERFRQNMNSTGRIGYIVVTVLKVIFCIAIAAAVIGGIMVITMPRDYITIRESSTYEIRVGRGMIYNFIERINSDDEETETHYTVNGVEVDEDNFVKDGDYYVFTVESDGMVFNFGRIKAVCVPLILYLIAITGSIWLLGGVFKALKVCRSPFDDEVFKKLKPFVLSFIGIYVFRCIFHAFLSAALYGGRVRISWDISAEVAIVLLIIAVLYYVYRYGQAVEKRLGEKE